MCFVSAVFDEFNKTIPNPTQDWKPNTATPPWVPTGVEKEDPKPVVQLDPFQLKVLLDLFHEMVSAAKKFDVLTEQPDCVDPEKLKLQDRVWELEGRLRQIAESANAE